MSFLSGLLLFLCYPKFSFGFLAWVALIPLLLAVARCNKRSQALLCGLIAGLNFFGFSLHWLIYVTAFGWVFVTILESVFLVFFTWMVWVGRAIRALLGRSLWMALCWTTAEVLRSEIPVFGFGWNLLAYSQSGFLRIMQWADIFGAYGLGFAMALVNALVFTALPLRSGEKTEKTRKFVSLLTAVMVFFCIFFYGHLKIRKSDKPAGTLRASVIQGNIPQEIKWLPGVKTQIIEVYRKLTQLAAFEDPDIVIWPEASFPGYLNRDKETKGILELARQVQTPLLVGSPFLEGIDEAYNSAYLIGRDGEIKGRYDKLFLVPFGEYVPLKPLLGWLEPLARSLGVSDFRAGHEFTIFRLMNEELPFGVLICFEDTFPQLARNFVRRGSRFLVVITNDAWFGPTAAAYQHLAASQLRAVENGVPVIRAANTGISAFISAQGEVLARVEDPSGKDIFILGHKTFPLPIINRETFYRKGGWVFPYVTLCLWGGIFMALKKRQRRGILSLFAVIAFAFFAGCLRLKGDAGYWYQRPGQEEAKYHGISFDTQELVQRDRAEGKITT